MIRYLIPVILVVGLFVLALSAYTVAETEQVIITQFGEPVGEPVLTAGLHFRMPFVQDVRRFEKRVLQWDGDANQIVTSDKKYIFIDTMARWRIRDPLLFLQAVQDERGAQSRLDDVIDGAVRDVISSSPLREVVRSTNRAMMVDLDERMASESVEEAITVGREELGRKVTRIAALNTEGLGIELLDVRIKRINYITKVMQDVYQRMISERRRVAQRFRSEGSEEASRVQGQTALELAKIESDAYRQAEEFRGKADAEASAIYADAFQRNPEFYSYWKTLETYRSGLLGNDVTLLLSSETEFFHVLKAGGKLPGG